MVIITHGQVWYCILTIILGVDIALWAHEHEYQRMWPVYDRKVYNGTTSSNPYEDPGAPVHLVTGSAVSCSSVLNIRISVYLKLSDVDKLSLVTLDLAHLYIYL